ncbi:uncharacterized protein LOC126995666 [Eriocheir sinensis]|uniref:uncharacterized protein LOC126995666 n=1 Tax=Eriocheir sinensis TaxID=95602 RepID=UPI0021CA8E5C|nr:uncharacterized protein LOC126995666 [Eriocheir sinensis]XP_050711389.1 uncharacterized protein LOC126995666 [Eriocheir sinensis]
MRVTVLCGVVAVLVAAASTSGAAVPKPRDTEVIDGRTTTIALAIVHQLVGLIPNETVQQLINVIIDTLTQEEFDYWGEVKDEVMLVVGQYINEHNMNQVEVYQEDLVTLLDRYNRAPVESDSYPDKNQQAAALSTSIITHRYLVEAALLPESMILHFEDISSIHVVVLKDAADTYSYEGMSPSRWWVDLDEELEHYIAYGRSLRTSLREKRIGLVTCDVDRADKTCSSCYDTFVARDGVTGEESVCKQLHGNTECESHCDLFLLHKESEVDHFMSTKVNDVISGWEELKELASSNAAAASRYYDPKRAH